MTYFSKPENKELSAKENRLTALWREEQSLVEQEENLTYCLYHLEEDEQVFEDSFGYLGLVMEGLIYNYHFSGELEMAFYDYRHEQERMRYSFSQSKESLQSEKRSVIDRQEEVIIEKRRLAYEIAEERAK